MKNILLPIAIVALIAIFSCKFMPQEKKKEPYCAMCTA